MKNALALSLLIGVFASCSSTASPEKKDTYTMPKGGMSNTAHEMQAPACDGDTNEDKKDTYVMPKGGMSNTAHEMKK